MAERIVLPTRRNFKDLTGRVFGLLKVISFDGMRDHNAYWHCRCECGNQCSVRGSVLSYGRIRSCGCLWLKNIKLANQTHGLSGSLVYGIWGAMIARCKKPGNKAFPNYGGRGICVCERWMTFENFYADMGPRPSPKHSLDRIDNNGNYEPGNVRWVVREIQARNNRRSRPITLNGRTQCLADWAAETGISIATIHRRLKCGWTVDRALTK